MIPALVRGDLSSLWTDKGALGLLGLVSLVLALAAIMGLAVDLGLFRFIAFVLVPVFCTAVGAVQVSGERSSGYAAVLHTAPITPRAYYASKLLVSYAWGLLALAIAVPYAFLLAMFAGAGSLEALLPWVAVAALLCAFSACLGLLVSVLVGKRGLLPSAFAGIGLAIGLTLAPLFLMFFPEAMRRSASALARLSPVIDVIDPASQGGIGVRHLDTAEGLLGYGVLVALAVVFAVLGYVIYTRLQNPEGWDAPSGRVAAVLAVGALLVLAPPLLAGGDPFNVDPRAHESRETRPFELGFDARLVDPGEPVGGMTGRFSEADGQARRVLRVGEPARFDLVLRGFAPTGLEELTDARVVLAAASGLQMRIEPPSHDIGTWSGAACRSEFAREAGGTCLEFPEVRIPVTVTVTGVRTLRDEPLGGLFSVELRSDQGRTTTYPAFQGRLDVDEPPWWAPLVVYVMLLSGFAAPHALRARRLVRHPALVPVRPVRPPG